MTILSTLQKHSNGIYILLASLLTTLLLADYIPNVDTFVTPPIALFLGLAFALLCGKAYPSFNKKASKKLLQYSVIGLGFGMNLQASLASGKEGMAFTIISVAGTMLIGWLIGRKLLKVNSNTSYLISSGTAICGGSAIASVGPVIKAKDTEMSVALGTIFILNAIALFIFPIIGHWLGMSQEQFGLWAAIAIHDTSSVVGAGAAYGEEALKIATTVKLTRALWIIPLALATSFIFRTKGQKISIPWFILWFVVMAGLNTFGFFTATATSVLSKLAKYLFAAALAGVGFKIKFKDVFSKGLKPIALGGITWLCVAIASYAFGFLFAGYIG